MGPVVPARLLGETVEISLACQHTEDGPAWVIWEQDGPAGDRVSWQSGDDLDAALDRFVADQLLPTGRRSITRVESDEPWLHPDHPYRWTVNITPKHD
ncbi:hypothetical protein [Nocardiopsis sp. JB363]|uniref:hypothetical protein n=1 Tax=Nocardiopsis sp. JB363 TaxID=1434837 RepID=UPI00097AA5E5|nr:hypothetical protein [Nocardiopsis sp. JB363]SIO90132.1 hypothetical protein BQ8420_25115 [Nocardiopsis sp. JB363]